MGSARASLQRSLSTTEEKLEVTAGRSEVIMRMVLPWS